LVLSFQESKGSGALSQVSARDGRAGRAFFRPVGERLAPELIGDGILFVRQASAALEDARSSVVEVNARRKLLFFAPGIAA
jgi:hypothetical protein